MDTQTRIIAEENIALINDLRSIFKMYVETSREYTIVEEARINGALADLKAVLVRTV